MKRSTLSDRDRSARSRLRQILEHDGLVRATWVELRRPCGNDACRCAKAKRHWHESFYISQSRRGRLRRKSIPRHLFNEVDLWLKSYWEARELLDQISEEYWARLEKPGRRS